MKKISSKEKRKIIDEWIHKNGAASFDLKNKDIWLWDSGLFSIEKEKFMRPKVRGYKKLPNGAVEILFTKKKYPSFDYKAVFWMQELDETINYLKRMKKMLNSIGYRTNEKKRDIFK